MFANFLLKGCVTIWPCRNILHFFLCIVILAHISLYAPMVFKMVTKGVASHPF